MFERKYLQDLKERIAEPRKFIQVVAGPRQVGKTTLANQLLSKVDVDYVFESADGGESVSSTWLQQIWETARLKIKGKENAELILVIDEIQKIDNWSEIVKRCWDKDTRDKINIKVILLGSSRLLLKKGLTESLAGRFEMFLIPHWSYSEMCSAFGWDVKQYVFFGGYPGSADLIHSPQRWKDYVKDSLIETSISKDILMLTRIDKPAVLRQLFEIGSLYSGQIISLTKILGQLQDAGNTTTLSHYLNLLTECGFLTGLNKYSRREVSSRASIPKFQVLNNALLSAQSQLDFSTVVTQPIEWGRLVESAVGAHLLNNAGQYKLFYWREKNQEVDFVLQKGAKIIALEVKSGTSLNCSGMSAFIKEFNPSKTFLIGSPALSYETFLELDPNSLF